MDSLHICWRGPTGSGKKTTVYQHLQKIANQRGLPFHVSRRYFQTAVSLNSSGTMSSTEGADDTMGSDDKPDKNQLPYEYSLVHVGFDVARMSMQDKIFLKPILQKWGLGGQVLGGNQENAHRILVFYHIHLLSSESCFLFHSLLEECAGNISIWATSELPVPFRLSDYFLEIPVAGQDNSVERWKGATWKDVFRARLTEWATSPNPTLSETAVIRSLVYEILMRNLRWVECIHILMDVVCEEEAFPAALKRRLLSLLAEQEATAAGQTIPSYRIPLLWESLLLQVRHAFSDPEKEDGNRSIIRSSTRAATSGRGRSRPS